MVEKLRIGASRIFAAAILGLMCVGESYWDGVFHSVSTLMISAGVFLVGVASVGRLWCSLYIAGYKTSSLVTAGPYSMCRNPLYFFSFLGALGVGLFSETFLIPALILVAFLSYYPLVIKSEEKKLMRLHGDRFEAYVNRVPRFFPRRSLLREPEKYLVKPPIFRKHVLDVLWFVWILGFIEIIEECRRLDLLPVLLTMY